MLAKNIKSTGTICRMLRGVKKCLFFKLDACLIKKDKSLVWVNVTTVLFNDNDETFGFTIFENVTYLKHFEESEKRLNMALQYSKMAVWEMDLNNYSVVRSQSHDELFGYEKPLEKWNKETYLQHLLPEDSAAFEEVMRSLKNERILDYRGRIQAVNKVVKWVYFQGRVETNAQGKPVKVLGTINDITKEKIAERHKDEFITTVSHELKTPITSIKAQTQVLERRLLKAVDADTANMFRRINLQISRLNTIIKDLLEVGQLEEQKLPFRNEGYLFNEMVEETVADIQRTTATHQILIENNRPTSFIGDRERTSQVVSNLLTNAIKYSPGKDKVIVRIEEHQDQVFCSIQDFGIGISPEKQADIFKRFYRATGSSDYGHVFSGLGLGYTSVRRLLKGLAAKFG